MTSCICVCTNSGPLPPGFGSDEGITHWCGDCPAHPPTVATHGVANTRYFLARSDAAWAEEDDWLASAVFWYLIAAVVYLTFR